jgi:gamma-glutamyltranspeptidase / glutathione hydrolase
MRRSILLVLTALALAVPVAAQAQTSGPPLASGKGGGAATVDRLATGAAIQTLQRGGNAVDAAVAAAAVLGVTEPFSCGIGGGGFMVIRTKQGDVTTIDSRETAPAAMTPTSFRDANGAVLPFSDARYSGLSAGVPGTVAGWDEALDRFGRLDFDDVLGPAIRVAEQGFVVDQTFFDQTQGNVAYFDDITSTRALYLDPDGTPRDVGTELENPDLADVYRRIARRGADGFYSGPVAQAMVAAVTQPPLAPGADHTWRPGVMTLGDVSGYDAEQRDPTRVSYRGLDVWSMGPPSSGGSTVGEALNILSGYEIGDMDRPGAFHHMLEASRYSFADRNAYLADPAFFDVPLEGLLSQSFAAERRSLIGPTAANATVPAGDPYPHQGDTAPAAAGASIAREGKSTTHLVTSDKWGNVVSYTFTIESTGGNGIVVPGHGFLLNNELTDFNFDSTTHPNRVEGGKRPRSSMAPTIVTEGKQSRPVLALGSPGGATIITTVLQLLVDRIDLGTPIGEAIAAPRVSQRNAATSQAEAAFISSPVGQALASTYGHAFSSTGEIGAATALEFGRGQRVLAAAEPVRRGGGSAGVVRPSER